MRGRRRRRRTRCRWRSRAAVGAPWRSRAFRGFLETAADGTRHGDFAVAVAPNRVLAAIGGRSRTVRLSAETAAKRRRAHPDLKPDDYALVQRILDGGELFRSGPHHALGFVEIDGRVWRAVYKATRDGAETYVVSLHRVDPPRRRRAARTLERIGGGE